MNNDGYIDIILGALGVDVVGGSAGALYVIYGSDTAPTADVDLSTFTPGVSTGYKITGAAPGDQFSSSLAPVGDVNQDGTDDFIVGAWGNNGQVYIFFGTNSTDAPTANIDLATSAQT